MVLSSCPNPGASDSHNTWTTTGGSPQYCPAFPERFGSIADARIFCEQFLSYAGIGLHTPASVHYGTARDPGEAGDHPRRRIRRQPPRFRHRRPTPLALPNAAWVNKPTIENDAQRNPDRSSQIA